LRERERGRRWHGARWSRQTPVEFVRLANVLPSSARLVWDRAARRVFYIGMQGRRHPFSETYPLNGKLPRAAAGIGADVAITLYALAENE
jgi:hypothetical protein